LASLPDGANAGSDSQPAWRSGHILPADYERLVTVSVTRAYVRR